MWSIVRNICLGLWVGAMAGFAFLFAPTAFAHVGPTPAFAATIAACVLALARVGSWLGVICAAITLFARLESRRAAALVLFCIALALVMGTVESTVIVPQMEKTALLTPAYETLHRQSSAVFGTALLAALAAFAISSRSAYRSR